MLELPQVIELFRNYLIPFFKLQIVDIFIRFGVLYSVYLSDNNKLYFLLNSLNYFKNMSITINKIIQIQDMFNDVGWFFLSRKPICILPGTPHL